MWICFTIAICKCYFVNTCHPVYLLTTSLCICIYRIAAVKAAITTALTEEAENWIGCGMTYTLFECLKEKHEELIAAQPDHASTLDVHAVTSDVVSAGDQSTAKEVAPKKEQLTKSQKRRQWEQSDHSGNKPRGYNWVDIVKHLSQTGGKEDCGSVPTNYDG